MPPTPEGYIEWIEPDHHYRGNQGRRSRILFVHSHYGLNDPEYETRKGLCVDIANQRNNKWHPLDSFQITAQSFANFKRQLRKHAKNPKAEKLKIIFCLNKKDGQRISFKEDAEDISTVLHFLSALPREVMSQQQREFQVAAVFWDDYECEYTPKNIKVTYLSESCLTRDGRLRDYILAERSYISQRALVIILLQMMCASTILAILLFLLSWLYLSAFAAGSAVASFVIATGVYSRQHLTLNRVCSNCLDIFIGSVGFFVNIFMQHHENP